MSLYKMEKLRAVLGNKTVLDIESLTVEKGVITAFMGPNGAGKTTLFNILAFLRRFHSGSLVFDGIPLLCSQAPPAQLRQRAVLVPQEPIMFSSSVEKNVAFGLKCRGISLAQRTKQAHKALDEVGMLGFAKAAAHRLSGGETKRVALARAIVLDPEVLLCDEPTAGVDSQNRIIILELIGRLNAQRGMTVLITSHNAPWLAGLASRMVHLDSGRIAEPFPENTFLVHPGPDGRSLFLTPDGPELVLEEPLAAAGTLTISLDPKQLALLPASLGRAADKNSLSGVITGVLLKEDRLLVTVNAGVEILISLSLAQWKAKNLGPGDIVQISIPASSIRVLPEKKPL
ncbi:MAG: ABC transporter ATP-binding protein [Desulfatibacillaceae bacterium]|nr:ABC transporter ATP-binding protein [Desulfatibacillaceae bacterium]